jgi:hypothetical protein
MMHYQFQDKFSEALIARPSENLSKRFAVYRNNVFVGLVDALRARYPAVETAVGTEFFTALARDYASCHQPKSPIMMNYGDGFPDFIATYDELRDYSWLVSLARLEMMMTDIYHARDQKPVEASAFSDLPLEALATLRITFIDACAILQSEFPLATLWQMNTGQIEPAPIDHLQPEVALIYRDGYDVSIVALSHDDAKFLKVLHDGDDLSDAIAAAENINPGFVPQRALSFVISKGLILHINTTISEKR